MSDADEDAAAKRNPRVYQIVRFYHDGTHRRRVIKKGLTLEEAQAHCGLAVTSGFGWFDGYDFMDGCRPKKGD